MRRNRSPETAEPARTLPLGPDRTYGMTKTAQLAVARGMAETTRGIAVTVNAVLPGPTDSEGVGQFIEQLAAAGKVSREEIEREFFKTGRPICSNRCYFL
jgi:NAD(P)-dependent dehydrogenase (short-subunit alcohol dehydrogenase family)